MDALTRYLEANREQFLEDLEAVLRIPSVSTEPRYKEDMQRCARKVADDLRKAGMTRVEVVPTAGHPVVYAEWLGAPGKPTALVYGHYDVQPVDPLELWTSPPFEPTIRDGKLYARGACDDKGQVYMHVAAFKAHMAVSGKLPVNVKCVIEGEEEAGSENLERFLRDRRAQLDADVIVVSDTGMLGPDQPALTYGLRGLLYTQIDVTGPSRDLHSGEFGGAVQNPANALATIIAALKDGDGRITVPGFYENVKPLSPAERAVLAKVPFDEAGFLKETGAPVGFGEKGYSTLERVWVRPTCDVNGMSSGYTGEGAKTVLPSFASAKVSMRLVPDQDPKDLFPRFAEYVRRLAPPGVTVKVQDLHSAPPFMTDHDHPMLKAAVRALARSWSKPPAMVREGGSIPVMATFKETHDLPSILMGFALPDDNLHAPNEKFNLTSFHGGTKSVAYLYEELAKGA
jgi:acetylornithine deacetylase/succinyl-diaminopimelate desuccinylase-like protein